MTTEKRAYLLPSTLEPEDDVCIRVYVPNEQEYIDAFFGGLEYFGKWVAWERDVPGSGTHKGAIAAARWMRAIERTREQWECAGGDCGIMDIRQSTTPCIIEKQIDCDGEWETAADLRLCVPKMRIFGGVLQQDTTGSGDWQNAGDPDDPYDPRTDAPAPPPWEDPPPGETGECLSAANVATYVDFVAYHFAASMVDGLTFFQTLSGALVILTALLELIPLTLLTAFITALYQQVIDSWADVRDFSIILKLTDLMVCKYNADGSMTEAQFNTLIDECNAWRDTLTDNDERAKWWIAIATMQLWGPVGMTISGQIWGISSYECSYGECQWEHTFDFTLGELGWALDDLIQLQGGGTSGVYISSGWVHTDVTEIGGYHARDCSIDIEFDESTIKRIRVVVEFSEGTWDANAYAFYAATDETNYQLLVLHGDMPEGESTQDVSFSDVTSRIRVAMRSAYGHWNGSILIKSIIINGTGIDPFA